jgi:hypothetical protein
MGTSEQGLRPTNGHPKAQDPGLTWAPWIAGDSGLGHPFPSLPILRIGGRGNLGASEGRQAVPYGVKLMGASLPPGLVSTRALSRSGPPAQTYTQGCPGEASDPRGRGSARSRPHGGGSASQLGPVHRDGADGFMADHGGAASRGSGSMWKSFPTVGAPWAPPNKVRVPPRATRSLRTRSDLAAVDGGAFRSRTPLPFSTIVRIGGSGNLPTSEARQAFPYRVKLMRASFPPGLVTGRTLVQ